MGDRSLGDGFVGGPPAEAVIILGDALNEGADVVEAEAALNPVAVGGNPTDVVGGVAGGIGGSGAQF